MINTVLVVLLIVTVSVSVFGVYISDYYYSSVRTGMLTKAQTATDFFANYITKTSYEFYQSAYKYTEQFEDRDRLELQFVNTRGRIIISTYGLTAGISPGTGDITQAIETKQLSVWVGKSPTTGEKIMAVSSPMIYANGQVIGVMRYVTSLKLVDRQVFFSILIAIAIGVAATLFVLISGRYFIRSIVEPVQKITSVAKRIADGSYGIQIDKAYDDEIGEMVDTINEMSLKISQSEKTQTEFISTVSHELRTPLTAITGWGETLYYDDNLGDDARRGIGIILKEARRLTTMVEELLDFTRIADGRFTLSVEQIDLAATLEDSIFAYREILKMEEISLEYEQSNEELPMVPGDAERLKQVFLNIFDNATKYGKEGGRIVVSIEQDAFGENIIIKIRDFGPGIPEGDLPHVKMKFYKGSSKERGSGIGLSVCEEITKLHNGTMDIENAEGGGVSVTLRLPVSSS